jgi:hypothetical protein
MCGYLIGGAGLMSKARIDMVLEDSKYEVDKHEWDKMKSKGKRKYLLKEIFTCFISNVWRGILGLFIIYFINSLWFDGQWNDIKNVKIIKVLIILFLFVASGLIVDIVKSLCKWNKYKKRYGNLNV